MPVRSSGALIFTVCVKMLVGNAIGGVKAVRLLVGMDATPKSVQMYSPLIDKW